MSNDEILKLEAEIYSFLSGFGKLGYEGMKVRRKVK